MELLGHVTYDGKPTSTHWKWEWHCTLFLTTCNTVPSVGLENTHPHRCFRPQYSRITSTNSPSFCMTTSAQVSHTLQSSYLSHMTAADKYWHCHCSNCWNTYTDTCTTLCTLLTYNSSLGLLMSPEPEAGGFVESILLHVCIIFIYYTYSWIQEVWVGLLQVRFITLNTAV